MRLVRLRADRNGASYFEDVEVDLPPEPFGSAGVLSRVLRIAPSGPVILREVLEEAPPSGHRHCSPRRQLEIHLAGVTEVETSGGEARRFGPGDLLLLEDTEGLGHVFRPVSGPRLMAFVPIPDDWQPPVS